MPRKPCYWTRRLELQLVEFIRKRHFIWKYTGNTNHHIQQKYKAYAEFAASLGPGFTARSVRDRWVNIRNTFNYNLRKVDRSKKSAKAASDVYIPSWPLWKPLQFLREASKKEDDNVEVYQPSADLSTEMKEEHISETDDVDIGIRQRGQQTNRPRRRTLAHKSDISCAKVLDELIEAVAPLASVENSNVDKRYHFFGRYVTEKLNSMRSIDAESASREILRLFDGETDLDALS